MDFPDVVPSTIDLSLPSTSPRPRQNGIKIPENKANRWTNQKNFHRYKNIPTPRVTIYNTTSYSHDQDEGPGYTRQIKLVSNLESLATHSDFIHKEIEDENDTPLVCHLGRYDKTDFNSDSAWSETICAFS